jgi:hypothetical protein
MTGIERDVTGRDITQFMPARELAATGEVAATTELSEIRKLRARLDSKLFAEFVEWREGRGVRVGASGGSARRR